MRPVGRAAFINSVQEGAAPQERAHLAGSNPYKLHSFGELRRVLGPLWVRCDTCRRFRRLRVTRALRDRDHRRTRFRCQRCSRLGVCTRVARTLPLSTSRRCRA